MDDRPELVELDEHVRTDRWHSLGLQLGLEDNELSSISLQYKTIEDCCKEMFRSWLRINGTKATRLNLLTALRNTAVAEKHMADRYETYILSTPRRPDECELDVIRTIKAADELKEEFACLITEVSRSLSRIDVDLLRRRIYLYRNSEGQIEDRVLPYLREQMPLMKTPQDILDFLIVNKFIGYLNYGMLNAFLKLIGSTVLDEKMQHYEVSFTNHLHFNFSTITKAYKERPDLAPASPTGLPTFIMNLESQWEEKSVYSWRAYFDHRFQWAPDLIVASYTQRCVLITYAVLPSAAPLVVKDLSNMEILKQLEDSGVTVELSSELLHFEQLLEVSTHDIEEEEIVTPVDQSDKHEATQANTKPESETSEAYTLMHGLDDKLSDEQSSFATKISLVEGKVNEIIQKIPPDRYFSEATKLHSTYHYSVEVATGQCSLQSKQQPSSQETKHECRMQEVDYVSKFEMLKSRVCQEERHHVHDQDKQSEMANGKSDSKHQDLPTMRLTREEIEIKKAVLEKELQELKLKTEMEKMAIEKETELKLAELKLKTEMEKMAIEKETELKLAEIKRMIEETKFKDEKDKEIALAKIEADTTTVIETHRTDTIKMLIDAASAHEDKEVKMMLFGIVKSALGQNSISDK